jgi:hypothetical protein
MERARVQAVKRLNVIFFERKDVWWESLARTDSLQEINAGGY